MNLEAEQMSADLRDELAANNVRRTIDPRSIPCRFSLLKEFARSPLHYWHACQYEHEETLSMRLGSGAHALLFGKPLAVFDVPAKTGKGKAPRNGAQWEEFKKAHEGETIVNAAEKRQADKIAKAVQNSPLAMRLLKDARIEERIDWNWNGRAFRSTPDALGTYHMVDLKCLKSADPERVAWQARSMHYHAQAALYRLAVLERFNRTVRECYLIVVENKEPHPVTVLRFTETALDLGNRLVVAWNERRRVHEEANEWPGYVQSIVDLDMPGEGDIDDMGLVFDESESTDAD